MTQHRSDSSEVKARVDIIYQLILQGWGYRQLVQFGTKKWGVKTRQTDKYIQKARVLVEEIYQNLAKNGLTEMLARHADMRERAYNSNDLRLVLDIDREDAKLFGLYAPEKKELTGARGAPIEFIIKEREETA